MDPIGENRSFQKAQFLLTRIAALFFFCAVLAATSTNGTSGDNRYFADIMSQALMENTDKNMVYSPSSAHTILSLAYHASDGNTREILAETLDIVDEERRENENNLESEGVEWYRANSIYLSSRYELSADFANKARSFGAQAENIDFSDGENAAALMNGWIENKTDRMIKDLVDPENLDASTVLVMLNAVFFKGKWLKTFKPEDTKLGNFYLMNDTVKFVEMMHIYNADSFKYFESETFDAKFLQMFYSNRCFSMTIILPNKQEGIEDLKQYLYERGGLKMQLRQLRPVERINVTLPKFTIESALDLEPALRKVSNENVFVD